MKRIISDQAVADLTAVWSYIAGDDTDAADRFVDTLYGQCEQPSHSPGMGRARDEVLPGLRSFPVGRYIIFYRSRGNDVETARILSAYRDIGSLL